MVIKITIEKKTLEANINRVEKKFFQLNDINCFVVGENAGDIFTTVAF